MIQSVRLNSNIHFGSAKRPEMAEPQFEEKEDIIEQTPEQPIKATPKDVLKAAKDVVVGSFKSFNNVADTTQGALKGIAQGALGAVVVGTLGKNIKNSKGRISSTLKGIGKDIGKATISVFKAIPSVFTKSPIANLKSISSLPKKFYTSYLKGNKLTGAIATTAGVGIFLFKTIQGKMHANLHNANIDHRINKGHVKY